MRPPANSRRSLRHLQLVGALVKLPPLGIRQPGAKLGDRGKEVLLRVVNAAQKRADAELPPDRKRRGANRVIRRATRRRGGGR